jgi:hypothetical protein
MLVNPTWVVEQVGCTATVLTRRLILRAGSRSWRDPVQHLRLSEEPDQVGPQWLWRAHHQPRRNGVVLRRAGGTADPGRVRGKQLPL